MYNVSNYGDDKMYISLLSIHPFIHFSNIYQASVIPGMSLDFGYRIKKKKIQGRHHSHGAHKVVIENNQ